MKNTKKMILCSMFTVLIIVGAFIRIPTPLVPITLQVTFVLLAGILLGSKGGAMSAFIYLALGLVGVPVFTGGGGLSYVLKPTFGYLLGFIAGAFVTGRICENKAHPSLKRILLGSAAGIVCIYGCGLGYFLILNQFVLGNVIDFSAIMMSFVLLPLPSDIISCSLGAILAKRLIVIFKEASYDAG